MYDRMTHTQRWMLFLTLLGVFIAVAALSIAVLSGSVTSAGSGLYAAAIAMLFTEVVGVVVALSRGAFLPGPGQVLVTVAFPGRAPNALTLESCVYIIRDGGNTERCRGNAAFVKSEGGWICRIPADASDAIAELHFSDHEGNAWRVGKFSPLTTSVEAYQSPPSKPTAAASTGG